MRSFPSLRIPSRARERRGALAAQLLLSLTLGLGACQSAKHGQLASTDRDAATSDDAAASDAESGDGAAAAGSGAGPDAGASAGEANGGQAEQSSAEAGSAGEAGDGNHRSVSVPPLPTIDTADLVNALAKNSNGDPVLVDDGQGAQLVLDTKPTLSPVNALARCSAWLDWCVDQVVGTPGDGAGRASAFGRARDTCWANSPSCATATPWQEAQVCCPAACAQGYASARRSGANPATAELRVLFEKPRCIPGLDADLAGAP